MHARILIHEYILDVMLLPIIFPTGFRLCVTQEKNQANSNIPVLAKSFLNVVSHRYR